MARLPRLDLPQVPQHIVQRGNNREPCFVGEEDYSCYRQDLADAAAHCGCAIHAYVLMTNHVHLLVTGTTRGGKKGVRFIFLMLAMLVAIKRLYGTVLFGRFAPSSRVTTSGTPAASAIPGRLH